MTKINEPQQQRSIEKKNKILEAGFKLITEKGYHNTNTAEIAKEAGVSSGIVYRYFSDKKDIMLQAIELFAEPIFVDLHEKIKAVNTIDELKSLLPSITTKILNFHQFQPNEFRELKSISMLDADFNSFYINLEHMTTKTLVECFQRLKLKDDHLHERAYLIWSTIDDFCDRSIQIRDTNLNLDFLYEETMKITYEILDEVTI